MMGQERFNVAHAVLPASAALLAGMVWRMGWLPALPLEYVHFAFGMFLLVQVGVAGLAVAGAMIAAMIGSALWLLRRLIALLSAHPSPHDGGPG